MATNRFVKNVVSTSPGAASAPGFGIPMLVSYNADFFGAARSRSYSGMDAISDDWDEGTLEYMAAQALFSQDRRPDLIVIGRGSNKPTMLFSQSLAVVSPGETYSFPVVGSGVLGVTVDVVAGSTDVVITTVTAATDVLTKVAHGMLTGAGPYYVSTSSALPAGLVALTPYWVIRVDDDNFKLASSAANALAGTAIDITSAGTGTQTLVRTGNDVLVERIVAGLNAVAGKNYTAAATGVTGSKTWTVIAITAGAWFSIGVDHDLVTSAVTHIDPGIAADLTAIRNKDGTWYELHTAYNSTAMVAAASTWIEASDSDLIYHPTVSATVTVNAIKESAGTHDIADQMRTLARTRTAIWYHPDPASFLAEAVAGRMLPTLPGESKYAFKPLRGGVAPVDLTDTQRVNLEAKNANSYAIVQGTAVTFLGKVSVGEWIDIIRNVDAANSDLQFSLWGLQLANEQVPMTPDGRALVKGVMVAWAKRQGAAGIFRDDEESRPVVDLPLIATITAADKRNRKYAIAKWSAAPVDAIVYLETSGTVTR